MSAYYAVRRWVLDRYYDLRHLPTSLRVWTTFVVGWRAWDWEYAYRAYFLSVKQIRDHVATHQHHENWESDVAEMDEALRLWALCMDGETWEAENAAWDALHDHMKAHARGWWC